MKYMVDLRTIADGDARAAIEELREAVAQLQAQQEKQEAELAALAGLQEKSESKAVSKSRKGGA